MADVKILMADDEPEVLNIMAKQVRAQGFEVVTAQDGEDAWHKIQVESPDIILLDLNMPKMDGFDVLKKLRENPPSPKWQPVIIVSAKSEMDDMHKSFKLEADHYITKPCKIEDIFKGIHLMQSLIPQRKTSADAD